MSNSRERPDPLAQFRDRVLSLTDPEVRALFAHPRLSRPFSVAAREAFLLGRTPSEMLVRVAEAANREAMSCLKARDTLEEGSKAAKAMDIMMKAWLHLHEACLYAEREA